MKALPVPVCSLAILLLWCHESKSLLDGDQQSNEMKLKKLTEKMCPGTSEKFDAALQQFKECSHRVEKEEDLSLCETIEKNLRVCTKEVVKFYEECLPEKSKELPQFFISMLESIYKTICDKMDGEHIIEVTNPCLKEENIHTIGCMREYNAKITHVMRELKKNAPTKVLICASGSDLRPCVMKHVNASCEATVTRESFLDLYDAVFEPCGEEYVKEEK